MIFQKFFLPTAIAVTVAHCNNNRLTSVFLVDPKRFFQRKFCLDVIYKCVIATNMLQARPSRRNQHVRDANRGTPERLVGRSLLNAGVRSGFVHKTSTRRSMWSGAVHFSGATYRSIRNVLCGATQYTMFVLGTPFRLALKSVMWSIASFKR